MNPTLASYLQTLEANLLKYKTDAHYEHILNDCSFCKDILAFLTSADAVNIWADKRLHPQLQKIRSDYAEIWAQLNVLLEYDLANHLKSTISTYPDFKEALSNHWLGGPTVETLIQTEITCINRHTNLNGAKVCMVGPGPIPYTALALAHAGAHVSMVDISPQALSYCQHWFKTFNLKGSFHLQPAEQFNFQGYDVVMLASMLFNKSIILQQINTHKPAHIMLRTSSIRRPLGSLMQEVTAEELGLLSNADFLDEAATPLNLGNYSLLYHYPQAKTQLAHFSPPQSPANIAV